MVINEAPNTTIEFTPEELRLVCKALGGRLSPEEIGDALDLDRKIARTRIALAEQRYTEMMKLKKNLGDV
jgi:hypothetical protein